MPNQNGVVLDVYTGFPFLPRMFHSGPDNGSFERMLPLDLQISDASPMIVSLFGDAARFRCSSFVPISYFLSIVL
jgi:hypothetical protein